MVALDVEYVSGTLGLRQECASITGHFTHAYIHTHIHIHTLTHSSTRMFYEVGKPLQTSGELAKPLEDSNPSSWSNQVCWSGKAVMLATVPKT